MASCFEHLGECSIIRVIECIRYPDEIDQLVNGYGRSVTVIGIDEALACEDWNVRILESRYSSPAAKQCTHMSRNCAICCNAQFAT
jgi:hypothetical protein